MSKELQEMFKNKEELEAWVTFNNKFGVLLEYADIREFSKMMERAKTRDYTPNLTTLKEGYDSDKMHEELILKVRGLRSLTFGMLAEMTNATIPEGVDPETEVGFDHENIRFLVKEVYGFAAFLLDTVGDIANFRLAKSMEEKKTLQPSAETGSD